MHRTTTLLLCFELLQISMAVVKTGDASRGGILPAEEFRRIQEDNLFDPDTFLTSMSEGPSPRPTTYGGLWIPPSTGSSFVTLTPPSSEPSTLPTSEPSKQPSKSSIPSTAPSIVPSNVPSFEPSLAPSMTPSLSALPSVSLQPSFQPTMSKAPSMIPSRSLHPSLLPSASPAPTSHPSNSVQPSLRPTISQEPSQSILPSSLPSNSPSMSPTIEPWWGQPGHRSAGIGGGIFTLLLLSSPFLYGYIRYKKAVRENREVTASCVLEEVAKVCCNLVLCLFVIISCLCSDSTSTDDSIPKFDYADEPEITKEYRKVCQNRGQDVNW